MKEKRFSILDMLVVAVAAALVAVAAVALTAWLRLGPGGLAMLQSAELIQSRFVGEYDQEQVTEATLDGMVEALGDRWTGYLTPQEYAAMNQRRENAYVGVGLTYQQEEDPAAMRIVSLAEGSPAQAAGLQVGEAIVAIDGQTLTGENFDDLVATIGTEQGQTILFTVLDGQGGRREVQVTTARVETSPVEYELLDSGVGYVRLANFFQHSAKRAQEAVDDLVEQGATALLFDVRYNPGGYVSELTELLDYLLPQGSIFAEHTKNGPTRVTQSDAACVDLPMAVLINADSYSAAELFAAQLRESVDAPLVGMQTCGKGYYQQSFPLANGGALNLSTGMYTTGGGTSLIGVGLTPDVVEEDADAQLERAVELLLRETGE